MKFVSFPFLIRRSKGSNIISLNYTRGGDWIDTNLPDRIGSIRLEVELISVVVDEKRRRRVFNVVGKWLEKIWMIFIRVERPVLNLLT